MIESIPDPPILTLSIPTLSMPTLEDAIALAATAHKGQTDKAGAPYVLHLLRVMRKQETRTAQIVAVLHDLVEDTPHTFEGLKERGYSAEVITALRAVTRQEGEGYAAFAARAAEHPVGRAVKRADLEDNMDVRRLGEISGADAERLAKYHAAWTHLRSAEEEANESSS